MAENRDDRIIPGILHSLRPEVMYNIDQKRSRALVESVHKRLQHSFIPIETESKPSITVAAGGEPIAQRCGIPHEGSQAGDLQYLFLDKLYQPKDFYLDAGDEISSFYIKRAIYFAFFGTELPCALSGQDIPLSGDPPSGIIEKSKAAAHIGAVESSSNMRLEPIQTTVDPSPTNLTLNPVITDTEPISPVVANSRAGSPLIGNPSISIVPFEGSNKGGEDEVRSLLFQIK
jgi:hypothetical protein